jgi:glycosyltransferase 2 family protein
MLARLSAIFAFIVARRWLVITLQVVFLSALTLFLTLELRSTWHGALPRLRHARVPDLCAAGVAIAAYYLVFVFGWQAILRQFGAPLPYLASLRAEMLSLLAKYVPGGVWTPAARVVAARRYGVDDTTLVLTSIALEAGLSAISGVLVLLVGLLLVGPVSATIWPVALFGALLVVLVHPRVFARWSRRLVQIFGVEDAPPVLSLRATLALLLYYCGTWVLGGLGFWFIIRSVADPPASSIPFLGGVSAVGAIVSVLVVFAPSGLGVREASTYALILAVASRDAALGAVVLNRLVITAVEGILLAAAAAWPDRSAPEVAAEPEPEPSG